ncbi:MAG: (2Fe-2S)-binding protein [Candidatus Eremiobacteraeota bacterium]|nr:(2Fe-2S)-binding protein [Candidatus Eremiobacteraeota bacterium]MBV8354800.1 (2Fe-2S)-binding protein [Candidatus Eremiobacteraeota bacterium]
MGPGIRGNSASPSKRPAVSTHTIRFELNGERREMTVPANRLLIDLLRDELQLFGTKEACSVGVCGVCSVLVDGKMLSSCLLPAVFVDGACVTTVEGLSEPGALTAVQEAFIRRGGFQCGICTPGQIVAATALLAENEKPSRDEIREWMMGNLCRCTGYEQIVEAIETAANA